MNHERIALLKEYIKEEPENPFNQYALAMEYYELQPLEALEILETLLNTNPEYLPTYYKIAHLYWEMESWEKAEKTFASGIQLAEKKNDEKALGELKASYQNFEIDKDS